MLMKGAEVACKDKPIICVRIRVVECGAVNVRTILPFNVLISSFIFSPEITSLTVVDGFLLLST